MRKALASDESHTRAKHNLERVTGRSDEAGVPVLDLLGRADDFVCEIRGDEDPVQIPLDTTSVVIADSIVFLRADSSPPVADSVTVLERADTARGQDPARQGENR